MSVLAVIRFLRRLTCRHDYRKSRFVALGQIGVTFICAKCGAHQERDQ